MGFQQRLTDALADRRSRGLYRTHLTLGSSQGPLVRLDGKNYLNFCSNDYLGLAAHPCLVSAFKTAADQYGVGSGSAHLVCGHLAPHLELEQRLIAFTGRQRVLLFSSGYQANMAVLTSLLAKGDRVFEDRLNHASLLDGGLHSGARFRRFPHNDSKTLATLLAREGGDGDTLVAVDGVFSMDGDCAPLAEIAALCRQHSAWLMVDDAHGIGVLGATGLGSTEAAGLSADDVPVLMATFGKALGTGGAFVAGSETLVEGLTQLARGYIYTTAMAPAIAAATVAALDLLQEENWRRQALDNLVQRFRRGARQLDLPLMTSNSAIQPLLVGDAGDAMALSGRLNKRGVLISAIRPPTVPQGSARLRITLTAGHSEDQIDELLEHLRACITQGAV